MKKIAIVMFVVSAALAGCGKKKAPEAPATDTTTAPAGETTGSDAAPAGDGSAAPDAAGGAGSGM